MNLQLLASGVSMGFVYGMIAMGMVLIFRSVGIMNFAQGEFLMLGGYLCYTFNQLLDWPILFSIIAATLCMIPVGVIFQRLTYWPLRSAQVKAIIVSAMGASIAFKEAARLIWGAQPKSTDKLWDGAVVTSNGAFIQKQYIAIMIVAAALMTLIYLLLEKTFIGNILQATAQDQYMASLTGVPVVLSVSLTFGISALITGICGGLLAPLFFINTTMGSLAGSMAFAAIVIGGFGSVPGAIIGGQIVGLISAFGGAYISSTYQLVIVYGVLILFLMFRPQGIFGAKIQEKA